MAGLNGGMAKERGVDIIFCIDGTGSMVPCIDAIKKNATNFYKSFVNVLVTKYNSVINALNVKVITFRDYASDGADSMVESGWFELGDGTDEAEYEKHVMDIIPTGGGDDPENGMEALYFAMTSKWKSKGTNDRQVIVLFTDADALPLKERSGCEGYPENMVDEKGLLDLWMGRRPDFLSQSDFSLMERNKRMVIFAPAGTQYAQLQTSYNRCQYKPVAMDSGLVDIPFDDILDIIAASAST